MSKVTKLFFTEQTKLSQLTLSQVNTLLLDGESNIYVDSNNILRISEKNNGVTTQKNATGDIIKTLSVSDLPTTPPTPNTSYSLMAVSDGSNYKLIWGLVDTLDNYNVITGNTTYTVVATNPTHQIFDVNTPDNYKFNGDISITVGGDGANVPKKYSIDNGIDFTPLNSTPNFIFENLGSMTSENYDLVIQDEFDTTIYSEAVNLLPPDYLFKFIGVDSYKPVNMSHVIYKSYDINSSIESQLDIIVDEDDTFLPGLYNYLIFDSSNNLVGGSGAFISDKIFTFPTPPNPDQYRAEVVRINGGYIELGEWVSPTSINIYQPTNFLWSKDNGQSFSVPSFNTQPFLLQNNGESIRINYSVNEVGEPGGNKKIYMRLNGTDKIYQSTHFLPQDKIQSNPINQSINVEIFEGVINDVLFGTPFNSDSFSNPTIIRELEPFWVNDDFLFKVEFLSDIFIGEPVELYMMIEDLNGEPINQIGLKIESDLIAANPKIGMVFEFNILDFKNIISQYVGEILRVRFIFNPNEPSPNPVNFISSKLKFVLFV